MNNLMMHCIQAMCGLLAAFVLIFVSPASAETKVFYSHNDQIGTPQLLTDTDQTVVWQIKYQPFGEDEVVEQDADGNGVAVNMPLRFPGQYYDSESGLHYNYFRDYDPSLGRYVQSDPIGLDGGLNTYAYVEGNPISKIDPTGQATVLEVAGGLGLLGSVYCLLNQAHCQQMSQMCSDALSSLSDSSSEPSDKPDEEKKCDLRLDGALTAFSMKKPGTSYSCVYRQSGSFGMFSFPQWKGLPCYPVNLKTCMVDTSTMDPTLYGR